MNRRDLHFVPTPYEPGVACECKCNAYEWRFCDRHAAIEEERHVRALNDHAKRDAIIADYLS